ARAVPALSWPLAAAIDDTSACALLPISAVNAGPPPLVGRWRSWMPADFMNSAIGRGSAPEKARDEKIMPLGRVFSSSMKSARVFCGCRVVEIRNAGSGRERAGGDKVGVGEFRLPAEQAVDLGEAGDGDDMQQQCVAVRLGAGGELRAHGSCCARLGLDHCRLLDQRLEHGGERTSDDVGGAARR